MIFNMQQYAAERTICCETWPLVNLNICSRWWLYMIKSVSWLADTTCFYSPADNHWGWLDVECWLIGKPIVLSICTYLSGRPLVHFTTQIKLKLKMRWFLAKLFLKTFQILIRNFIFFGPWTWLYRIQLWWPVSR